MLRTSTRSMLSTARIKTTLPVTLVLEEKAETVLSQLIKKPMGLIFMTRSHSQYTESVRQGGLMRITQIVSNVSNTRKIKLKEYA